MQDSKHSLRDSNTAMMSPKSQTSGKSDAARISLKGCASTSTTKETPQNRDDDMMIKQEWLNLIDDEAQSSKTSVPGMGKKFNS